MHPDLNPLYSLNWKPFVFHQIIYCPTTFYLREAQTHSLHSVFQFFNAYQDIAMPPKSIAILSEGGATNSPAESGNGIQREDNSPGPAVLNQKQTPQEYNGNVQETRRRGGQRISAASARRPGNFRITRLIRNTDKAGQERESEIDLQDPNFAVNFGDYLLHLEDNRITLHARFRNVAGQEAIIPTRMTRNIAQPWGLNRYIPIVDDDRVGIPISFATQAMRSADGLGGVELNEAILDLGVSAENELDLESAQLIADHLGNNVDASNDVYHDVIDVDRQIYTMQQTTLERRYEFPWNLHVDKNWLNQLIRILRGGEEDDVTDEEDFQVQDGGEGSPSSSKTNGNSSGPSESPAPAGPPGKVQEIVFDDDRDLLHLLERSTVKAHKKYQRAIRLMIDTIRKFFPVEGRDVDEIRDRDHIRAAFRDNHPQIQDLLAPSAPYKEIDCHEMIGKILEILWRFEPKDSPLAERDSPLSSPGLSLGRITGNSNQIASMSSVRGNNNTQTAAFINHNGKGSGRSSHTKPSNGKRPRGPSPRRDNDEDDEDGNEHRKRSKIARQYVLKKFVDKNNMAEMKVKAQRAARRADAELKKELAARKAASRAADKHGASTVAKARKPSKDGEYAPPGGKAPPLRSKNPGGARRSDRVRKPTLKAIAPSTSVPQIVIPAPKEPAPNTAAPKKTALKASASTANLRRKTAPQVNLPPKAAPKKTAHKAEAPLSSPDKSSKHATRPSKKRKNSEADYADDESSPTNPTYAWEAERRKQLKRWAKERAEEIQADAVELEELAKLKRSAGKSGSRKGNSKTAGLDMAIGDRPGKPMTRAAWKKNEKGVEKSDGATSQAPPSTERPSKRPRRS
jgi:hypothetical protein